MTERKYPQKTDFNVVYPITVEQARVLAATAEARDRLRADYSAERQKLEEKYSPLFEEQTSAAKATWLEIGNDHGIDVINKQWQATIETAESAFVADRAEVEEVAMRLAIEAAGGEEAITKALETIFTAKPGEELSPEVEEAMAKVIAVGVDIKGAQERTEAEPTPAAGPAANESAS